MADRYTDGLNRTVWGLTDGERVDLVAKLRKAYDWTQVGVGPKWNAHDEEIFQGLVFEVSDFGWVTFPNYSKSGLPDRERWGIRADIYDSQVGKLNKALKKLREQHGFQPELDDYKPTCSGLTASNSTIARRMGDRRKKLERHIRANLTDYRDLYAAKPKVFDGLLVRTTGEDVKLATEMTELLENKTGEPPLGIPPEVAGLFSW